MDIHTCRSVACWTYSRNILGGATRVATVYRFIRNMNHYEVLGVSEGAGVQEVVTMFRKKALEAHPDKGGDREMFAKVQAAYEVLSDAETKAVYDDELGRRKLDLENCASETYKVEEVMRDENATTDGMGWELPCRCGGVFEVLEDDIEATKEEGGDTMVVGCTYCSLQIEVVLQSV